MSIPLRVAHIAQYDKNIGDSIAALGARELFSMVAPREAVFTSVCNSTLQSIPRAAAIERLRSIAKSHDVILVGGGGQIQFKTYIKEACGWFLPFDNSMFDWIKIPVVVLGIGFYQTRSPELEIPDRAIRAVESFLSRSRVCMFRNDGSQEELGTAIGRQLNYSVGPFTAYIALRDLHKQSESVGAIFQPVLNNTKSVNKDRFPRGIDEVAQLIPKCCKFVPHSKKDFRWPGVIKSVAILDNLRKNQHISRVRNYITEHYRGRFGIVMRGHGQIAAICCGIPSVFLSTQEKIRQFSVIHGFSKFCIDIEDSGFAIKAASMIEMINNDDEYRNSWFAARDAYMESNRILLSATVEKLSHELSNL